MYRVLIADDEYYFREAMKQAFPWQKYDCEICAEASNGEEALEKIQKFHPDIILADINMPFLNGLELIKRARQIYSEAVFIIISGFEEFEYARTAVQLGVFDYVLKPVGDDFEKVLGEAVEKIRRQQTKTEELSQLRAASGKYLSQRDRDILENEIGKCDNASPGEAIKQILNRKLDGEDWDTSKRIAVEMIQLACEQAGKRKEAASLYTVTEDVLKQFVRESVSMEEIEKLLTEIFQYVRILLRSGHFSETVNRILNSIHKIYREPDASIAQIADETHLNYHYLCTQFKKETGMTVNHYLTGLRMQYAVVLLHCRRMTVQRTAMEIGIPDTKYFSKCFKKQYGLSPKQVI